MYLKHNYTPFICTLFGQLIERVRFGTVNLSPLKINGTQNKW